MQRRRLQQCRVEVPQPGRVRDPSQGEWKYPGHGHGVDSWLEADGSHHSEKSSLTEITGALSYQPSSGETALPPQSTSEVPDGWMPVQPGQMRSPMGPQTNSTQSCPSPCSPSLERWQHVDSLWLMHNEVSNGSGTPGALTKPVTVSQGLCRS